MQTNAVSFSWSLQLDKDFAFDAIENEQQHWIDNIACFSFIAIRTDTYSGIYCTCQKEICADKETGGAEASKRGKI